MVSPGLRRFLGLLLLVLGTGVVGFLLGRAWAPHVPAPVPHIPPVEDGNAVDTTTRPVRLFFAGPSADKLQEEERWEEGDSVTGLLKVAHRKTHAGRKDDKEEVESTTEAEAATPEEENPSQT